MTWTVAKRVGLVIGVLVLAAACSGRTDDEASSDAGTAKEAEVTEQAATSSEAAGGGGAADEGDADGDAGGSALAVDTVALAQSRDVVRTGSMRISVDDVDAAAVDVRRLAATAGGFVADEQVLARDAKADLTLRVPSDRFDDVRTDVAELGDVAEQDVDATDVTAEVVDVESRIAALRASVDRVRALLSQSGDVAQLATVEGELARREAELEALLGQQRVLRDQVDLATLTIHLSEDETPAPSDDSPGFADGLRRGWVAAVDGGRIALAVVGFVLPFALPAALAAWLVRRWQQRRRPATSTT
jgi:Domain of unknown function (DUF4349)